MRQPDSTLFAPLYAAALPLDVRKVCDLPQVNPIMLGYAPFYVWGHSPRLIDVFRKVIDLPHIKWHSHFGAPQIVTLV